MAADSLYTITTGGDTQAISISTTSAQSAAINAGNVVVYSTVFCFVRRGANPTALSDGTDQPIPASTLLPLDGFAAGEKLAIITPTGTGTFYVIPGA